MSTPWGIYKMRCWWLVRLFLWLGLNISAEILTEFDENEFVVSDGFFEVGGG